MLTKFWRQDFKVREPFMSNNCKESCRRFCLNHADEEESKGTLKNIGSQPLRCLLRDCYG